MVDAATFVLDAQGVELVQGEKPQRGKASTRPQSTTNVLLEAANWNFINIRQTLSAQRERGHEISSEAGMRFSRGVHPAQAEVGLKRAAEMMRTVAGGTVARGVVDEYPQPAPVVTVDLPLSEVARVLGVPLSQDEVAGILEGLEFSVERKGKDALRVTVPDHRLDIGAVNDPAHAGIADLVAQADLLEEIARIYGYDRLPNTLIEDELPPQRSNEELLREEQVRDILVKLGLQEIVPYRLTTPAHEAALTPPGAPSAWPDVPYVTLANPISQDKTVMRHTLLASMLDTAVANARWQARQMLFEVGKVYLPVEGQKLPYEPRRLGIVMLGQRDLPNWQDTPGMDIALMDTFDLKGVIEELVDGLHLGSVRYEAATHSTFFPGRVARLVVGGEAVGVLGELHPAVREAWGLPNMPVLVAELDLDALVAPVTDLHAVRPVSNYPAVYQDIALVLEEQVPAADIEAAIWEAGGWLLRGVRLFDTYRGEQIGAGKKSLAYALTFQADDKTLRDKDADRVRGKIVKSLEKRFAARLRS